MTDFPALIAKLEAWTPEMADFHRDRQLADEVLIAGGWKVERDAAFEGGISWSRRVGIGTYFSCEASRPHPLNDVQSAIGILPAADWSIVKTKESIVATVMFNPNWGVIGRSREIAVAVCIAAVKALRVLAEADKAGREARQ